jgi:lysophospholipase L1-like esterase
VTLPKLNVYRILYLGDSCTQQGYPALVELFLNSRHALVGKRVESVSMAMSGYSSYQGRMVAELYGRRVQPNLVVVYFGWNDHWRAYGNVDAKKVVRGESPGVFYRSSRLIQGLAWLGHVVKGGRKEQPLREVRVPVEQYRENLLAIESLFSRDGVPVIFITAPTSHYRLGVPDSLIRQDYVEDKQSAVRLHRQYSQIVREVAALSKAPLLDLEAEFTGIEDLRAVFLEDGVHFTPSGLALVGKELSDFVEERFLGVAGHPVISDSKRVP